MNLGGDTINCRAGDEEEYMGSPADMGTIWHLIITENET